ncbi:MAG: conjugal transfer protein TrbL family protein [Solirubrobacteraceae bacterium]
MRARLTALLLFSLAVPLAGGAMPAAAAPATRAQAPAASTSPAASPPLPSTSLEGASQASGGIEVGPSLPTPSAPASGAEVEAGKASHPGFFDVGGKIEAAINEWFAGLVKDALNPAMVLVGRTLLSTPQVAGEAQVRNYWQLSVGVADSLLVLVVMAAGALVMGHETLQTSYAIKDVLPRLGVAAIAVNASLAISGQMVNVANVLASGLLGNGVDPEQAGDTLEQLVLHSITDGGIFLVLLGLACAVLAVALLILYLVRASLIVLFVCAAPLMLLGHGLPQTEGMARLWWRVMLALLGVQVAQAITLAAAVHIFFASGGHSVLGLGTGGSLIDLLLVLCLFWVLLRIPFWAKELVGSRRYSSNTARMAKTYVIFRVIRGAVGGVL